MRKNQNCKIACSFEDICKKTPANMWFLFFYKIKSNLFISKNYIAVNIVVNFNSFFDVLSREKIRMEKFSVVSKIYTKNGSKIEIFFFNIFFHLNIMLFKDYCNIFIDFCCSFTRKKQNFKIPNSFEDMVKKPSFKIIKTNFSKIGYFLETINWINPKSW